MTHTTHSFPLIPQLPFHLKYGKNPPSFPFTSKVTQTTHSFPMIPQLPYHLKFGKNSPYLPFHFKYYTDNPNIPLNVADKFSKHSSFCFNVKLAFSFPGFPSFPFTSNMARTPPSFPITSKVSHKTHSFPLIPQLPYHLKSYKDNP